MGIAGCYVTESFYKDYLGMRNEYVDMSEIQRRLQLGIYDPEEFERAIAWTKENCREGEDPNPADGRRSRAEKDQDWEISVKMAMITRDLMVGNPKLAELGYEEEAMGHNAIAAGFQGQRQWTDFMPNGDFMEAILNTSFDWNGIRQPYILGTENDNLNAVTMLFGHLLTNTAQIFADVRTYWSPDSVKRVTGKELSGRAADGIIHLINSGPATLDGTGRQSKDGKPAMKPYWEITPEEAGACLDATTWHPGVTEYFRGGGFSSQYVTRGEMPVTMARINIVDGLGPALQIAEGWAVDIPEEIHRVLDQRTNPTWPTTWFVPRLADNARFRDVYSVMLNWGANHGAIGYGHYGADLITLASMLRIPVYMHNVDESTIFRPSAWTAFGMDLEGSDFRACENFGPLYRGS
jgi:L-fucose isomerase